jgi:hypothetical protein
MLSAHSGRTDGQGGHKDNKNKSGLGSYHYHCGGYPAHLHTNGQCPYKEISSSSTTTQITPKIQYQASKPQYTSIATLFKINGSTVKIEGILEDDITLVEMRPLCNALGIVLDWDAVTNTITCSKDGKSFDLTIGSELVTLEGKSITLAKAPKVVNGKTLLPARFVIEAIGKNVNYDSETGVIAVE